MYNQHLAKSMAAKYRFTRQDWLDAFAYIDNIEQETISLNTIKTKQHGRKKTTPYRKDKGKTN